VADPLDHRKALGAFIRSQRELANLSLRQMAAMAEVSNPYLSQIERGLHEPSVHILRSIAQALNLSAETLLEQAGVEREEPARTEDTERAIRADKRLSDQQKQALLAVYRSYCAMNDAAAADRLDDDPAAADSDDRDGDRGKPIAS
jgi:transcriptional regulator with XRE-family HTH domain